MIELINRVEILTLNEKLASFLITNQQVRYDPRTNGILCEPGLMYVEDILRDVTQEECDRWNKVLLDEYELNRDHISIFIKQEDFKCNAIYNCAPTDINTYILNLANSITKMATQLKWQSVIFLLDYSTPWQYQDNDYEPVKKALDYLKGLGANQNFNGGFKVDSSELEEFIKHLFWIVRCNASLPNCLFCGINSNAILQICKYGNLHFEFFSENEKRDLQRIAKDLGMIEIKDGKCNEAFSETGGIEGRQIVV